MDIHKMNMTIDYYNSHADDYFRNTVDADLDASRKRFAAYLTPGARIIDFGCGSGRDVLAFSKMGFNAEGLDASDELVKLASENLGVEVAVGDMASCIADEPYDGIWCCASLMHLDEEECRIFFSNLQHNLKPGGVLYMSVKSGIETGIDEAGRYLRDFTEDDICELVIIVPGLQIKELWYTEDSLNRNGFRWLNVIAVRL